jgi:hypothetical protein
LDQRFQKGYGDERQYHFLEVGLPTGGIRKKLGGTRKEAGQSCKNAGQDEWKLIPKLEISPTLMPLTHEEAKEFDAKANYSDAKYSDPGPNLIQNQIKEMDKTKLSMADFEKQERELSIMFVQAPVHSHRSVELFVKSKKSD